MVSSLPYYCLGGAVRLGRRGHGGSKDIGGRRGLSAVGFRGGGGQGGGDARQQQSCQQDAE